MQKMNLDTYILKNVRAEKAHAENLLAEKAHTETEYKNKTI